MSVAVPETYAMLFVTTEAGVTITVSKDGITLPTQTCVSGEELVFNISENGTWTVSGSNSISDTVSISSQGSFYIEILAHIYGVLWDGSSSSRLTRTDDAVSFSDPNPYYAGMSGEPSSPFDNLMPWAGMVQETIDGNVLVRIPKFWYKIEKDSSSLSIKISNFAKEGFSVSPAHKDRGDGNGERRYVYIGRYKCSGASTDTYKSQSGKTPMTKIGKTTARTNIQAIGNNYWQEDFAIFWTIRLLYIVEFADWNSQAKIGYGCGDGLVSNTGYTDSMPYHTGTMQSNRTDYGFGTQYRYIEGLWDNVREWLDGVRLSSSAVYVYNTPSTFSDNTQGTQVGTMASSNSGVRWIRAFGVPSASGFDWALYPSIGSSSYGYVCDATVNYGSSSTLVTGGISDNASASWGLFTLYCNLDPSATFSNLGCRLMYLPPNSVS